MRAAFLVLALIGLCACTPKPAADAAAPEAAAVDAAWSETPLYRAAAAAGTPLRPGLWTRADPACPFMETESTGVWPGCAEFMVVRPHLLITHVAGYSLQRLMAQSYLLIDGFPRILQLTQGLAETPRLFIYEGLRPLASDAQGLIVRARLWPMTCSGAPASGDPEVETSSAVPDCRMDSQRAVRSMSIATEDRNDATRVFHWVRDEEH